MSAKVDSLEVTNSRFQLDVKRLHLPLIVKLKCPNCGEDIHDDLDRNHLSFPMIGVDTDFHVYCYNCNYEGGIPMRLTITVEIGGQKATI